MNEYAMQALNESISEDNIIRQGGKDGNPFWNVNSSQFIYIPSFQFPEIPGAKEYIFTATDSKGTTHTFRAEKPTAPLSPIWKDIAVGLVELKVEAVHHRIERNFLAGARTFYKMAHFPGREALPERARSYKECATKAFAFVFDDPTTQYWYTNGVPKPDYYHNVYPSKTISSVISAMISYAELAPDNAEKALKIATNAADYLISITYGDGTALKGAPPTYSFKGLIKEIVDKEAPAAYGRRNMLMNIYPASAGSAYLKLEKATGDKKYLDAAEKIAEYYKKNVLPNGSWYLLVSVETGIPESNNCCGTFSILEFLSAYYQRTGDEACHKLEADYFEYIKKFRFENFNWEGQFEDIALSSNYNNLTHFEANKMIGYIADNFADDPQKIADAKEMMRFVEDQFVVWGDFATWNLHYNPEEHWYSPAALEQYYWHVPIDSSTATFIKSFLDLYSATGDKLLLEKACALGDAITRMQNSESGVIPTHWMTTECSTVLKNFWVNCHIHSASVMMILAKAVGEI